jgi:subtilase family serine protease
LCNKRLNVPLQAASPWVTAVGGTTGGGNGASETAAQLSAGGFSNYWARPKYQVGSTHLLLSIITCFIFP